MDVIEEDYSKPLRKKEKYDINKIHKREKQRRTYETRQISKDEQSNEKKKRSK